MTGRPSILTAELTKRICDLIVRNVSFRRACLACNISEAVFYDWRARGRAGEKQFVDFLEATQRAEQECLQLLELAVMKDAVTDGRLALQILERRDPEHWGRRTQVTGPGGGPVQVMSIDPTSLPGMSDEELQVLRRALAKTNGAGE